MDSAGSFLKGLEEIGSSMSKDFDKRPSTGKHSCCSRDSRTGTCLKGIGQASSIFVRAPVHIGVAFSQGLHNAPRIWGDRTVKPLETARDFPSGLKTGGRVRYLASHWLQYF